LPGDRRLSGPMCDRPAGWIRRNFSGPAFERGHVCAVVSIRGRLAPISRRLRFEADDVKAASARRAAGLHRREDPVHYRAGPVRTAARQGKARPDDQGPRCTQVAPPQHRASLVKGRTLPDSHVPAATHQVRLADRGAQREPSRHEKTGRSTTYATIGEFVVVPVSSLGEGKGSCGCRRRSRRTAPTVNTAHRRPRLA